MKGAIPFILGTRKVSYADQGTFSFAFWPFSIKLLWAPIIDSLYIERFGRRKSWLIPIQFLIGIFMLSFANLAQDLLYNSQKSTGNCNKFGNTYKNIYSVRNDLRYYILDADIRDVCIFVSLSRCSCRWLGYKSSLKVRNQFSTIL